LIKAATTSLLSVIDLKNYIIPPFSHHFYSSKLNFMTYSDIQNAVKTFELSNI